VKALDSVRDRQVRIINLFIIGAFGLLLLRFFQLQVLGVSEYRAWSDRNSVRQISVPANRGKLYDRTGHILVDNRPSYSLFVIPFEYNRNPVDADLLDDLIGMSPANIESRILEVGGNPFTPVRIIRDMDFETLSTVEENRLDLPGVFFQIEPVRTYPSEVSASHVLGYLGEVTRKDIRMHGNLRQGEIIGKNGLERRYDGLLRGVKGYQYMEVDVRGREVGNFGKRRDLLPVTGYDLSLTLDHEIQRLAESLLKGAGAVVVMDPFNGDILAMASKPDYSLESFARGMTPDSWDALRTDPKRPLLNRPVQAQIPPGSTWKLVTAAAALENELVSAKDTIFCEGYFRLGSRIYQCWRPFGHGSVDIIKGLKESCNVFFYQLGLRVGVELMEKTGRRIGMGRISQIDLDEEAPGLLPDEKYLDQKYGEKGWTRGLMANMAVGQGDLLVTPIQMARLTAFIATKGVLPVPRIVKAWRRNALETWTNIEIQTSHVMFRHDVFSTLEEGMLRAVNESGGTATASRVPGWDVCGKTGTAENPQGAPHAWFVGYAPRKNPRAVVVVLLENGGSGGIAAAPVAGRLFRKMAEKWP